MMDQSVFILILILISVRSSRSQDKFTILQFNDILGELESFEAGTDPPLVSTAPDAVGGIAKLVAELEKQEENINSSNPSSTILRVSPGNLIGGFNGWLSILGFEPFGNAVKNYYSEFVNPSDKKIFLQGYAMKEFESGLIQTNSYVNLTENKPIISNINCEKDDKFQNAEDEFCGYRDDVLSPNYERVRVIDVGKTKVGVVGFINPLAMNLSDPGNLELKNVAESLQEVTSEETFKDIKTFIAIGGGSYAIAKDVLDKVAKVKLFIYAGGSGHRGYPETYNGKFIAGSSALKYGENLGKATFSISQDGQLTLEGIGELVLVRDATNDDIKSWVIGLTKSNEMMEAKKVVGRTLVRLEGTRSACWKSECNLGNLVTDSLVRCAVNKLNNTSGIHVEDLINVVGIWNAGGLINDTVEAHSDITGVDIHKWLPYHNNAYLVILKGKDLISIFEEAGKAISGNSIVEWGRFMQVSDGVEVKYTDTGSLISLKLWHSENQIPTLDVVKDEKDYHLVMPSTLYRGRNSYGFLKDKFQEFPTGETFKYIDFDDNCLRRYIEAMGVLKIGFQGRIFIGEEPGTVPGPGAEEDGNNENCPKCSKGTAVTVLLTILSFLLVLAMAYVLWKAVWPMILRRRRTSTFP